MKAKKMIATLLIITCATLGTPILAQAESLDALEEKESALIKEGEQISATIQAALTDINITYGEVSELKEKVTANQAEIDSIQTEIEETEKVIAQRKEVMNTRMKEMQVSNAGSTSIDVLFQATSFSDFVGRAYALTTIQRAEKEKVVSLNEATEKLATLEADLETTQTQLEADQTTLEADAQVLNEKISSLQAELADNESVLAEVADSKTAEEARLAAEAEAKEKAAQEAKEAERKAASTQANVSQSNNDNQSNATNQSDTQNDTTNQTEDTSSGSILGGNGVSMAMESTAYSYTEPGSNFFTANGTDLRQNPQVIAVDPSVIPLGTLVEVSGYGVALAADTGGAIKGSIIDCHFKTVQECINWGRRQVTVTILS